MPHYEVLIGRVARNPVGAKADEPCVQEIYGKGPGCTHGDVIETDTNLLEENKGTIRFRLLSEGEVAERARRKAVRLARANANAKGPQAPAPLPVSDLDGDGGEDPPSDTGPAYDQMTVQELKEFAESQEINLGKATTKAQIIAAIRQHDADND